VPIVPQVALDTSWIEVRSTKRRKPKSLPKVSQSQTSATRRPKAWRRRHRNRTSPRLHVAATALHCDIGLQVEYQKLLLSTDGPLWKASAVEEWDSLAKGLLSTGIPISISTDTLRFIKKEEIPTDRRANYPRFVFADCPQKKKTKRVRVAFGARFDYPGKAATKGANLKTAKLLFNNIFSTPGAKFLSLDIQDFHLNPPMARPEYIRVALKDIPTAIIKYYDLAAITINGSVYCEINKGMYGLPQASI
jgi:hypothetical protein